MKARAMTLFAVLALLPLAGCIENMSDLKDKIGGSSVEVPPVDTKNVTAPKDGILPKLTGKEPVARVDLYQKGGAKLFGSDFVAADGKVASAGQGGVELSFVGSASEALDKNATIKTYEWAFGDGVKATGSTASHAYAAKGGVFEIALKVTDSKGRSDTQKLKIAINPALVVVNGTFEGTIAAANGGNNLPLPGPAAGADRASVPFTIEAALNGTEVTHVTTRLVLKPGNAQAADMSLRVRNATEEIAFSDASGPNEEVLLEGLTAEDLTAVVWLHAGLQGKYVLSITTTYQPVNHDVMGFLGEHGGGQHD